MSRTIEIGLAIPSTGKGAPRAIEKAVDALAAVDEMYLAEHPETPALARSGVRYAREQRGFGQAERWQSIPEILARGEGDCEDLAAWRIAELRRRGVPAQPRVVAAGKNAVGRWHIVVSVSTPRKNLIYDPSKELGM